MSALSRATGLHRPLIYRALPGLKEKGLVTTSPHGKQTRYAAESPERLKLLVTNLHTSLDALLPDLFSTFVTKGKRPIIRFLEGKKGITAVFEDLLQTLQRGDVFYRYSSGRDMKKNESYLPKDYRLVRDKKQLERFVITNEKTSQQMQKQLERSMKVLPASSGTFEYDVTQIFYGPKVAFIDYESESALIIESSVMAKFQIHLFKILFERL